MGIPRGERYEFCRSVHAEMNAIIAAPRDQMIGATLYLVGRDMSTGKIMSDANSCTMCKRLIINAGIEKVIIRRDTDKCIRIRMLHDFLKVMSQCSGKKRNVTGKNEQRIRLADRQGTESPLIGPQSEYRSSIIE